MPNYLPGKIIRHIHTGQGMLVLLVQDFCVLLTDPTEKGVAQTHVLLERDYSHWVPEEDMESHEREDENLEPYPVFEHHPITI